MLWKRSLLLTALLCFSFCFSQTQLKAGDISIIGLDCETEDFMFVTFVPLLEGTEIYFTDEEANGSCQIGLGEGTVLYTVPTGGLSRGSVISYQLNTIDFSITSDVGFALANTGDGLIAYQGSSVGEVAVFVDALGSAVADLGLFPSGFSGRVLGNVNGQYQGVRTGLDQASFLVRINDNNDWQIADSGLSPFDVSSFSFDTTPILYSSVFEILDLGYDFDEKSTEFQFVVYGFNLINDVELRVSQEFELSFIEGGIYSDTILLSPAFGSLAATSVFVRLKEHLHFSAYNGLLSISSLDASGIDVKLNGSSRMGYQQYCTDIFISEYVEGTSNNKYIELFNPTIQPVELTNEYQLEIYSNGSNTASRVINLQGVIDANDVFVIEHPSEILGVSANQQSGNLNFNGNDAIVLKKSGEIIDVVGQVGFDPGIEWMDGLCASGTADGGMIRKGFVSTGNGDISSEFEIDEEWICSSVDDISNLGIHSIDNKSKLTVWDGSSWSSGIPDDNDVAIMTGDYETIIQGGINSCMLFLNPNVTLGIGALKPVVLDRDIFIKGNLLVETFGSFIQTNDDSEFILVDSGLAQLIKRSTFLNNWYDYTFWSSPVKQINIETALSYSPFNRRYFFEANNFIDVLKEIGNTNVFESGTDDIDDNGDDWQIATGTMEPGRGYASAMSPSGFVPGIQTAFFSGEFNNGEVIIPVVANSGGLYNDWNLLGNPYPGGLNALEFLNHNQEVISGALYLWSHNSSPNSSNSGNESENFSNSDYAIITGGGLNVAGGDGIIPESFIPSAQGFFVEAIKSGNVVFNNSMRAYNNLSNSQFFKNSNRKRKNEITALWLNLTADNGVFSQIAIGFFENATDQLDDANFDVPTKEGLSQGVDFYSKIKNETGRYAIQGRALKRFKNAEGIGLGVQSNLKATQKFRIEIADVKGRLAKDSKVYIHDKLLHLSHDLSEKPYEFELGFGIYDDRFELLLNKPKEKELKETQISKRDIQIQEYSSGLLQIKNTSQSRIKEVELFDFLGKNHGQFKEFDHNIWNSSSKLSTGVYLVKILMASGQVFNKKVIIKN